MSDNQLSQTLSSTTNSDMSDDDESKISARSYQVEIMEQAKTENLIVCLPTGSGKTFIAIMLIKEWSCALRPSLEQGGKRTVLLVKTIELARQHSNTMSKHLDLKVKVYDSASQISLQDQQRWNKEFATYQVLIFTVQKFINLLDHNVFSLDKVNLLIFDECHHATGDDHYSLVMKKHYYSSKQPPRVLGLTASISGQKIEPEQLKKAAKNLENLYRARIETGFDRIDINRNSTSVNTTRTRCEPYKEYIIAKQAKPVVNIFKRIKALMDELEESSKVKKSKTEFEEKSFENNDQLPFVRLQCRTLAQLKSQLDHILQIGYDLGLYGLFLGVKALRTYLNSTNLSLRTTDPLDVNSYDKTIQALDSLLAQEFQSLGNNRDILYSKKVLKCEEYIKKNTSGQSIIFVERVYTAAFLCQVLREIFKNSPIQMKYLAGSKAHIDGITVSTKSQREVAREFRQNDINVLISTAIVEEGFDVPECNLVIRFNKPQNLSSYMQSKGRARAKNGTASFVLLMDEYDHEAYSLTKQEYEDYESMEKILKRNFKTGVDAEISSKEDSSSLKLYEPGHGVKIDAIRAVEIIYQYCAILGNGQVLSPRFIFDITKYQTFKCTLLMPGNCPCREDIVCENKNKKQAKQECCLTMVAILHKNGELDQRCLPIRPDRDLTSDDYSEDEEQDKVLIETIENQTAYFPHKHVSASTDWYLYEINLDSNGDLGFVVPSKLMRFPSFTLYGRDNNVPVTIGYLKPIDFKQYEKYLQTFCRYLFEEVFDDMNTGAESTLKFDMERAPYKLLPCFLNDDGDIDRERMARVCDRRNQLVKNPADLDENELYYSLTSPERSFHTFVSDVSLSKRAGDQYRYKKPLETIISYADYFEYRIPHIHIQRDYPMATMKDFRKPRINYLKNYVLKKDKELNSSPAYYKHFPVEVLRYAPLNQADLQLIYKLPTILVRLSQLFHIQQLSELLPHHSSRLAVDPTQVVNFDDCLTNICRPTHMAVLPLVSFNYASLAEQYRRLQPSPDLLFQAVTRRSADENTDMENLEILGDCFLKLAMSMSLFHQYPLDGAGKLTAKKDKQVSNKNLRRLAVEKGLQNYLNSDKPVFAGKEANWIPPGYVPDDESFDRYAKQKVKPKAFADMIEGLIGAFLISTNYWTTLSFMQWVGLDVIPKNEQNEVMRTPSILCAGLDETMSDVTKTIEKMFFDHRLDEIEQAMNYKFKNKAYLLAAFTHPSYTGNHVTQSYERLEYLGDAVLDFLVMRCVFIEHYDKVTPSRITDIRQDLSNNGRLAYLFVFCGLQKKILHLSIDLYNQINSYTRDESLFSTNQPMKAELSKDIDRWADSTAPKPLADVFEALVGAVFLDSGYSLEAVWKVIEPLLRQYINRSVEHPNLNPVRAFFEHRGEVTYEPNGGNGKSVCIAKLPNGIEFKGRGKNKKLAKYDACRKASTSY